MDNYNEPILMEQVDILEDYILDLLYKSGYMEH
jgi:hypothetical protein